MEKTPRACERRLAVLLDETTLATSWSGDYNTPGPSLWGEQGSPTTREQSTDVIYYLTREILRVDPRGGHASPLRPNARPGVFVEYRSG